MFLKGQEKHQMHEVGYDLKIILTKPVLINVVV